jgi:hypothetical protein
MDLLDFRAFFDVEPEWVHAGGWPYGARFRVLRGDDILIATVAPDEGAFDLRWTQGPLERLSFRSVMVAGWEFLRPARGFEALRLTYGDPHVRRCELRLSPAVSVRWEMA